MNIWKLSNTPLNNQQSKEEFRSILCILENGLVHIKLTGYIKDIYKKKVYGDECLCLKKIKIPNKLLTLQIKELEENKAQH